MDVTLAAKMARFMKQSKKEDTRGMNERKACKCLCTNVYAYYSHGC